MASWEVVAAKFKANPYVLGYDLLNEPWPANFYTDFSLIYETTKFDRTKNFALHVNGHNHIRKHDDEKILFFEPAQFPNNLPFFGGIVMPVGFEQTPGGKEYHNREVLNDHSYCC